VLPDTEGLSGTEANRLEQQAWYSENAYIVLGIRGLSAYGTTAAVRLHANALCIPRDVATGDHALIAYADASSDPDTSIDTGSLYFHQAARHT
jgi:hypothetical protein